MIQDIYPSRLNNQYTAYSPVDEDIVFFFQGSSLLAKYEDEETLVYPQYKEFVKGITLQENKDSVDNYTFIYLLSVDDTRYFLAEKKGELLKGQYIGEMADASIQQHIIYMAGTGITTSVEDAEVLQFMTVRNVW